MADNFTTKDASDASITGGADEIGGVKFPRVKIIHGADGTNDGDVSSANPLPTVQTGALPAGTNAIGKLAANSGVDIGDVDVASIAAGDNNIGNVDIASAIPAGTNTIGSVFPNQYELAGNTLHTSKYAAVTGTDDVVWSPAAGKRWYVTDIMLSCDADCTVTFEDDLTAGDSTVMKFALKANQGFCKSFRTPLFSGEDAADLLATTTAGNVYVTVTGYEV